MNTMNLFTGFIAVLISALLFFGSIKSQPISDRITPKEELTDENVLDDLSKPITYTEDYDDDKCLKLYKDYLLTNNEEDYFNVESACPYYDANFALYDIDNDGMRELIVTGFLGLRQKELSTICKFDNGSLVFYNYDGAPDCSVNRQYLHFYDPDYGGAGESRYNHELFMDVSIENYGTILVEYFDEYCYYDAETDTVYDDGLLVNQSYYVSGTEVSEDAFNRVYDTVWELPYEELEYTKIDEQNVESYFSELGID